MLKIIINLFKILPPWLIIFLYDMIKPFSGKYFYGLRYVFIKTLCKSIGKKVIIGCNVTFKHWRNISIGNNVSVHEYSYIDGYGEIIIGNEVSIAHHCSIISSSHTWIDSSKSIRDNLITKQPVTIGNNIWVGCGSRILGKCFINNDIIIGANSLVITNLESNGVFVGSPVRFVKPLYATNDE